MSLVVVFEVSKARVRPRVSVFLLSTDQDIEFSATSLGPCLSPCYHAPHYDAGELDL